MAKLKGGRRKEPPFTHIFLFLSFQCPEKGRGESKIIRPSSVVVVKNGSTLFLSCFVIPKPPDTIFLSTLSEDGCSFSNCCISSLTQGSASPSLCHCCHSPPLGAVIPYLFEMLGGVSSSFHLLIFATTYHVRVLHSFKVYFGTWLSSSPSITRHYPVLDDSTHTRASIFCISYWDLKHRIS